MSRAAASRLEEQGGPLALICGGGSLPFALADAMVKRQRRVVLFAIRGWADSQRVLSYPHHWVAFGQFGSFCRIAHSEGCQDVAFIGSVVRPSLWQLRPDLKTLRLLPRILRIFRGGDDYLLSGIASIFEEHGFRLISVQEIAPEIVMPEGVLGRHQPTKQDFADIAQGIAVLNAMSSFDIGQAAVISNGRVLAVEAAEGTDQMLMRIAQLRQSGQIEIGSSRGVLVKAAKRGQDLRLDLPSIGPRTIEAAARAKLAGVAVVAGSALVANLELLRRSADREGLFVIGVRNKAVDDELDC
jgi:UDP-2,3-diacylglucosamine hydrolase